MKKFQTSVKSLLALPAFLATFLLLPPTFSAASEGSLGSTGPAYERLLKQYVKDGVVDYAGLKASRSLLQGYLHDMARADWETFGAWPEPKQLAFLINLYNAVTLDLILEHYPVKSVKDIGSLFRGPWDQKVVPLFGEKKTLNYLEHEILRKRYREPRIHFAIVCAAKGCPPLRSEAYVAEFLDSQLEDQARVFFAQKAKNRLDREKGILYLSPIFKWFKGDFEKGEQDLVSYVSPYFQMPEKKGDFSPEKLKIRYTKYEWGLNEA